MKYQLEGLNELSLKLHRFQVDMGFTDSNVVQRLMLVASEIFEAFEAFREDKKAELREFDFLMEDYTPADSPISFKAHFETYVKDSLEDEITDSIIRLLAFCAENGINIERHIELKMEYNKQRGFKYGGKKF